MRRKKGRLSSQTLSGTVSAGRPAALEEPAAETPSSSEFIEFDILDLLRTEADEVTVPAAYNDPASVFTGSADFPADRFVFGLIVCPTCRNEMIYYQDRARLLEGYQFRCRVCQHLLVAHLA